MKFYLAVVVEGEGEVVVVFPVSITSGTAMEGPFYVVIPVYLEEQKTDERGKIERICYRIELSSRKCGEERGNVFMSPKHKDFMKRMINVNVP